MSNGMPALEIVEPGLLLTVQDLGRRGYEHEGVPRAGAADGRSLTRANVLAGNEPGAAALEATLLGPTIRALRDVTIGLAGADLAPVAEPGRRSLGVGRAHRLRAGETLECTETGDPDRGCRLYIAVEGGIDVPVVLGSRSTSLVGRFGGFHGTALQAGHRLDALAPVPRPAGDGGSGTPEPWSAWWRAPLRVLPGPAAREAGGAERLATLLAGRWTVSHASDRRGLRLDTEDAATLAGVTVPAADRPSFGVVPGAVQLTPSGQPIVLMPDGGVTGGYPVVAIVVTADLPALGQLVPGAPVELVPA